MVMRIKRRYSYQKGWAVFTFEAEPTMLSQDIMAVCAMLKKGNYIIEVFQQDPIDLMLQYSASFLCESGKFKYYFSDNILFLHTINVADIRYLRISTTDDEHREIDFHTWISHKAPFCVCIENYLDTIDLRINTNRYEPGLLTRLANLDTSN